MRETYYVIAVALAGTAISYGIQYLIRNWGKKKEENEEVLVKEIVHGQTHEGHSDTRISLDKLVKILIEVNKEFVKEQFMRDKYKTCEEYPTIPEVFLNRQIYPKVEEAYSKISNTIYRKFNVTVEQVDESVESYINIPEIVEQKKIIDNYFSLFSLECNIGEDEKLILPPDLTIKILQEQLEMNVSCLNKAAEEICKSKSISNEDLGKELHESESLMKEYTNIYTKMIGKEEKKLFEKYNISVKIIQISVMKHQSDSSFLSQFEEILKKRKNEYSRYGLDA